MYRGLFWPNVAMRARERWILLTCWLPEHLGLWRDPIGGSRMGSTGSGWEWAFSFQFNSWPASRLSRCQSFDWVRVQLLLILNCFESTFSPKFGFDGEWRNYTFFIYNSVLERSMVNDGDRAMVAIWNAIVLDYNTNSNNRCKVEY